MSSFAGGGRGSGRAWSSPNFSGGRGGGSRGTGGPFANRGGRGGGGGGGGGGRQHHYTPSTHHQQQQTYDASQQVPPPAARLKCCSYYVSTGSCTNHPCNFAHVIKMHAAIEASSILPSTSSTTQMVTPIVSSTSHSKNKGGAITNRAPISDVALYVNPTTSSLQIFVSSHDGTWRVYNATHNFTKELEHTMSSSSSTNTATVTGTLSTTHNNNNSSIQTQQQHKIGTLSISSSSSVLICGFEGVHVQLPHVLTGMIFAWNLHSPQDPPLEFHIGPNIPYAHTSCISCLITYGSDICISGSMDGTIRIWTFTFHGSTTSDIGTNVSSISSPSSTSNTNTTTTSTPTTTTTSSANHAMSKCTTTLCGHVGEITGLVVVGNSLLWSCSIDRTIRLWDLSSSTCVHVITPDSPGGHTDAITCLLSYTSTLHGTFIFSGSLDGMIKVWNPTTAECVYSTHHGVGVCSMDCTEDLTGHGLILVGTTSGKIMIRNILSTSTTPDFFTLLCSLDARYTCGHDGPVKCIKAGPNHTFYSGGSDGYVCVWEITGDFGL